MYFDDPRLRIFIIENIFHNHAWLSGFSSGIRDTDYFLVILGWHHGDWHALHSKECISACGLDINRFIIMCNDWADFTIFSDHGFTCHVINQNCFLDFNLFTVSQGVHKKYNAVYVARLTPFKRHELASSIDNLALVAGDLHGTKEGIFVPRHTYRNSCQLEPSEVQLIIAQSKAGLILSAVEGACFASSEYLLCGVPVVSTASRGGRDVWYNDYNSRIADATPQSVASCVNELIQASPSPSKIRSHHIQLSLFFRRSFIRLIASLFDKHGITRDPKGYFHSSYFHKMRESIRPDFDDLFPVI